MEQSTYPSRAMRDMMREYFYKAGRDKVPEYGRKPVRMPRVVCVGKRMRNGLNNVATLPGLTGADIETYNQDMRGFHGQPIRD